VSNLTTATADKLLDHLVGKTSFTMPTVWVGLYTTNPTEPAGTGGVEVSGGSYARVQLTGNTAAAASESAATSADLTWTTASASWGTVTGVGLFDASTAGNLLASGALTANKTVASGDTFSIPAGSLTVALA
jgi:hypothetical protein